VPTEDKITVEQRKNYTQAKSFLLFTPWNIHHLKLLKQKITYIKNQRDAAWQYVYY
jgi:hypothetical protein